MKNIFLSKCVNVLRQFSLYAPAAPIAAIALWTGALQAGTVYVPNGSFELPESGYADPMIDSWEQTPSYLFFSTGVFSNQPPPDPTYIDNCDGKQAAFIFASPGVEVSLDYDATDWTSRTHQFEARFEAGKSYDLTAGVIGGGGGMSNGVAMQIALYYRDDSSNKVILAATIITNSLDTFSNTTHFVDFSVHLPVVRSTNEWAGRHIGIQLLAAVDPALANGYWDVDNVRLTDKIDVPNGSFELPESGYADPMIDSWEQTPSYLFFSTGVFSNQPPPDPTYIDNCDGKQAAFIFASPGVEVSLDYDATDWTNRTQQFEARFEAGKSYDLTAGVIGGGGGMSNGVAMQIALYYRDDSSNKVVLAATTITNSPSIFSNNTHFLDFSVQLPTVNSGDAWAGKHIGIQLLAAVDPALANGYWDVDNVRLTGIRTPVLRDSVWSNGQFQFTLQSEPGLKFEILGTTNVAQARSSWDNLGSLTNVTGSTRFTDATAGSNQRYYQAHQVP